MTDGQCLFLSDKLLETIHLYIVREDETQPVVESTANTASETTVKTSRQPLVQQSSSCMPSLIAPLIVIAANLSIILAVFFIHIYPILTATATITIIPKSAVVTAHLTLSNVQSRIFQPVTLTQGKTVPATGKGHQDATQAIGSITLYNAATSEQIIDAGTLLIGSDGQHIVTDQAASIPGATPPIEGQVTVSAHVVNPGAAGNIQAGDIRGACCRENMFAYSSAFSGGADQRDYTMVTKLDINSVVSAIVPHLTASIQTSFEKQVHAGEALTPNQCSQNIITDRNAGDEATNVTVMVSESCRAAAYNQQSLQLQATIAFLHHAMTLVGTGYILHSFHPTITNVVLKDGSLQLSVVCQGDLIYHQSPQELQQLREALVGKTRQQAVAILSHLNGVDHLTLQLGKDGTFPTDPTHIHIVFLLSQ